MNNQALRAKINELVATNPTLASDVTERRDAKVAEAVNSLNITRLRSRLTTSRGIYAALGIPDGAAVMHVLNSLAAGQLPGGAGAIPAGHPLQSFVPVFADLVPWLKPPCDGLDFGSPDLQDVITQLQQAGLFSAAQANGLKALGTEHDTVTTSQVSEILNEGL